MTSFIWARRRNTAGQITGTPVKLSLVLTRTHALLSVSGQKLTATYEVALDDWRKFIVASESAALTTSQRSIPGLVDISRMEIREF